MTRVPRPPVRGARIADGSPPGSSRPAQHLRVRHRCSALMDQAYNRYISSARNLKSTDNAQRGPLQRITYLSLPARHDPAAEQAVHCARSARRSIDSPCARLIIHSRAHSPQAACTTPLPQVSHARTASPCRPSAIHPPQLQSRSHVAETPRS